MARDVLALGGFWLARTTELNLDLGYSYSTPQLEQTGGQEPGFEVTTTSLRGISSNKHFAFNML